MDTRSYVYYITTLGKVWHQQVPVVHFNRDMTQRGLRYVTSNTGETQYKVTLVMCKVRGYRYVHPLINLAFISLLCLIWYTLPGERTLPER